MHIHELLRHKHHAISFEIFPPKPESSIETVYSTIADLKPLSPEFISVTYGAGGSSRDRTVEIASAVRNRWGLVSLAHLTCMGSSPAEVEGVLEELEQEGVRNILAMRGDPRPEGGENHFPYAADLIRHIRRGHFSDFSIGAASYPEGHPECPSFEKDLVHLKEKVDAGVDFLVTQLFFDNEIFFRFMERVRAIGIEIPVLAGVMPVLNSRQIGRIVSLCGASIPPRFARIMSRYEHNPEALAEAGIAYATEQIIDLLSWGADGVHLYTMNRPDVARRIMVGLSTVRRVLNGET
ncbi:MAG: methylenetetrahydrofolate reductase [NAD(P)H] [Synergistaceae bacterium]|nr:methylenetetrahydrofolate reductase [NAD(P)H] [Synergistota bacterium]NLM71767.1 methylenetetrahydrofolate reductase [NAD(P)H] [Synergistaceae bacterium]